MSELNDHAYSNDKTLIVKVALALACKIAAIVCLGFFFFSSDNRIKTDAQSVSQVILADTTTNPSMPAKH